MKQIVGQKPHFQPGFVRRESVAACLIPAQRILAFLDSVFNIAPTDVKTKPDPPQPRKTGQNEWWRRGESNPRPKTLYSGLLRAFPVVWISSLRTPAGRVPVGPSRFGFRPASPREGDSGYPVRATPFRLHGHSAVGRTRLVRPRKRSYSRWRLLVPAFNEVRGASARNPGASTSPSKPFRPLR